MALAGDYTKIMVGMRSGPTNGVSITHGILGERAAFGAPFGLKRIRDSIDHEFVEGQELRFTNATGDEAISFQTNFRSNALFLYLPFTAAHWPLHAPATDVEKHKECP